MKTVCLPRVYRPIAATAMIIIIADAHVATSKTPRPEKVREIPDFLGGQAARPVSVIFKALIFLGTAHAQC